MDGTNAPQIAALNLKSELFLGDTFEHEGLGGVLWTLRAADDEDYQRDAMKLRAANPQYAAMRRRARRTTAYLAELETAGKAMEKAAKAFLGDSDLGRGLPALKRAGELLLAEDVNGNEAEGKAALQAAVDALVGKTDNRGALDKALPALMEQYKLDRDRAREESEEIADEYDDAAVVDSMGELEAAAKELLSRRLVVAVAGVPLADGETQAGGPELAFQMFSHPDFGDAIFRDVRNACTREAQKADEATDDHAKN